MAIEDHRRALNQALAKSMAYKAAGMDKEADEWARRLISLMREADLLWNKKVG